MLSIEQCKKILGEKAKNLSDENIEAIRDALYVQANLLFNHWQRSSCSIKGGSQVPPLMGQETHVHPHSLQESLRT